MYRYNLQGPGVWGDGVSTVYPHLTCPAEGVIPAAYQGTGAVCDHTSLMETLGGSLEIICQK